MVYSSQCSVVSCDISPSQLSQRISPPSFLSAEPHHKNHLLFLALFFFAWIFGSYIRMRAVWRMTVNAEKIKDKMLSSTIVYKCMKENKIIRQKPLKEEIQRKMIKWFYDLWQVYDFDELHKILSVDIVWVSTSFHLTWIGKIPICKLFWSE